MTNDEKHYSRYLALTTLLDATQIVSPKVTKASKALTMTQKTYSMYDAE
jgi:hypothetical protein